MEAIKGLIKKFPGIADLLRERDELLAQRSSFRQAIQRLEEQALRLAAERQAAIALSIDFFLPHASGVIHVGANNGSEHGEYSRHNLPVIWIEPIDEVFVQLVKNVAHHSNQRAYKYLVTDVDDREYDFHLSNNAGLSSSILDLAQHESIWPEVHFVETRKLTSTTLQSLFTREALDVTSYDALVMDTQGSELLVLKGAGSLLNSIRYIKSEAADFAMYNGACTIDSLASFLRPMGFEEIVRRRFAGRRNVGNCFDVVYERVSEITS